MHSTVQILFWCSIVGLGYIYAGYPLLMAGLAHCIPLRRQRQPTRKSVSIVIAAHNEARRLPDKIRSLLAMHGADQIVEILIGSDGSTDNTYEALSLIGDPRVRGIRFAERRGKPAVLNELIPQCRGEIVLLTDARQEFHAAFLTECLANFADETVGVVSGELVLKTSASTTTAGEGIGLYWKYEKFLRKAESRFRGVPGATGACYAIRRELFQPIPEVTILDDVAIPMTIINQGYRCVFEPQAIAYDVPSTSPQQEAIRKRRTIAGAAQLVRLYPAWIWPWRNRLWFEFVSHKLLRLVSPVLLIIAATANIALVNTPPYAVLLAIQFSFYVMAIAGWFAQSHGRRSKLFGPALMFLTLNLTTAVALWDAWRSRYRVTWTKAA
ncbi:glycosyltransferase [bacterium]|nr:glycosyltransferase [bacterium]